MNHLQSTFPQIKLSSLPRFLPDDKREIEMGIKGDEPMASTAFATLKTMLLERGLQMSET
jgi:hypothetical protein